MTSERGVPAGESCLLDTNALLYAHQGLSNRAVEILEQCASAEVTGYLTSTVWEELCHRLMVIEAVATGKITGPNPARKLSEHPDVVRGLREYRTVLSQLAAMRLRFEPVAYADILPAALDLQHRHGLLTNDSLIAACALRLGVPYLVSADECFARVPGLRVVPIDDVTLSG